MPSGPGEKIKRTSRRQTAATHTPEGSHPRQGYMAHPDVNVDEGRNLMTFPTHSDSISSFKPGDQRSLYFKSDAGQVEWKYQFYTGN